MTRLYTVTAVNRSNLKRLLWPATVAVVGASENLGMSNNAVLSMLDAGIEPTLINPNRPSAYGRDTAPSLTALGEPFDAVLALVKAERSVDVVEEAAALGCGGVVMAAGGFGEMGEHGRDLEQRVRNIADASGLAVMGPNCSGFMNVTQGVGLFTGGRIAPKPGAVAVISQSGFLVRACLAAGRARQLGFTVAISSGNETVCGLEDYVDLLADDPETAVVCLVVEKIRRPREFVAAVEKAQSRGKAVLAVKLGRTAVGRKIMRSHTGAIADESWVYELAFRECGVLTARTIDEMMDKAQLLGQIPPSRWHSIGGVGVVTSSGGVAAIAADAAADHGIDLPAPAEAEDWLRQTIAGDGTSNPLDMTGFARDQSVREELFERFIDAEAIGALVLCWWVGQGDEEWSRHHLEPFAAAASRRSKPLIVTPVEGSDIGEWTEKYRKQSVLFCRGIDSTFRALRAMDQVVRWTPAVRTGDHGEAPRIPKPTRLVPTPAGPMVAFRDAMEMLRTVGLSVAPFVVVEAGHDCPDLTELGDQLAVKLADVPHRSDDDLVRLGLRPDEVPLAVAEIRARASKLGLPTDVVVQSFIAGIGEAFLGVTAATDFGPILLFGRGGVQVESERRVRGRLLPMSAESADELVSEAGSIKLRGDADWDAEQSATAVRCLATLWEAGSAWLSSADINPLVVTADGLIAVDALILASDIDPTVSQFEFDQNRPRRIR